MTDVQSSTQEQEQTQKYGIKYQYELERQVKDLKVQNTALQRRLERTLHLCEVVMFAERKLRAALLFIGDKIPAVSKYAYEVVKQVKYDEPKSNNS